MSITKTWPAILRFLRMWIGELLILIGLLVIVKHYVEPVETVITADGIGYYDYLPSVFIRHDLDRKDLRLPKDSVKLKEITNKGMYIAYGDKFVNKYPCGVAILQSPFFLSTSHDAGKTPTGYEPQYQRSVYHAALFYLFLGLLLLKALLLLYDVKRWAIFLVQCGVALGTNLTFYVIHDAAFSHVYSFFAITAFLYTAKRFFDEGKLSWLLWSAACFGLVILLRQINCTVLFTLPFLAGNWSNFSQRMLQILRKPLWIAGFTFIVLALFSIQCFAWHQQTGHWLIYSYQGEYFDFSKPELANVLFSYRRGLFVYTPLILIAIISGIYYAFKRDWYRFFTYSLFFGGYAYMVSSWWSWMYGCSFGHRAFVDFYAFFFIPLAVLISNINWKITIPAFCVTLYLVISMNIIQTYQYKNFILHWMDMDKEKYWLTFLETDERFNGLVWKEKPGAEIKQLQHQSFGNLTVKKGDYLPVTKFNDSTGHFPIEQLTYIHMQFGNAFRYEDSSAVIVSIKDTVTNTSAYYDFRHLIHFQEKELGKEQTGSYWFRMPEIAHSEYYLVEIYYFAKRDSYLRNVKVDYYTTK